MYKKLGIRTATDELAPPEGGNEAIPEDESGDEGEKVLDIETAN